MSFGQLRPGGDVDEDGYGSRSSCTKLVPLRKLTAEEFLLMHANYVFEHPAEKFEDSYKGPFHVAYGRGKNWPENWENGSASSFEISRSLSALHSRLTA